MPGNSKRPEGKAVFPNLWKANVIAFLVILVVAISVAVWQTRYLDRAFLDEARDHARLAAEIISLNAENAIEAGKSSREIITSFLKSQIKFIRYLQQIEPFTQQELAAFATETGLSGIVILERGGKSSIESSRGWPGSSFHSLCEKEAGLRLLQEKRQFILNSPFSGEHGCCVIAGIDASRVLEIQQRISLQNTLKEITRLAGVKFARVSARETVCRKRNNRGQGAECNRRGKSDVKYLDSSDGPVVRVQFDLSPDDVLVLGMDASSLRERQQNIWQLLFWFSMVLVLTGGLVTWLLYRHQAAYLETMREYEERLYKERHEASLGRSAATIAHEIRNPLNSVSMGIQKIMMDSQHLPARHSNLLRLLQEELSRTERIISGLLTYARPLKPDKRPLLLSKELRKALIRIEAGRKAGNIGIDLEILEEEQVAADAHLVHQLFENLLSNAIDAQPKEGHITIEFFISNEFQMVRISNRGRVPSRKIMERIFDPYFTGKTRGTGLGLAICRRIMNAHKGFLRARVEAGSFIMEAGFPKEDGRGS